MLNEKQSNVVEMAHVLGHLQELKMKELMLAVLPMTQEEFSKKLAAKQEKFIVELAT